MNHTRSSVSFKKRRSFLKSFILFLTVGFVGWVRTYLGLQKSLFTTAQAETTVDSTVSPDNADSALVPPDDPVAVAIRYNPKGPDAAHKGQSCSKCALYTPKGKGMGSCTLLTSGHVLAGGWCASFQPKA